MDLLDKRMQCLRMAAGLGGDVDAVMDAAQRMLNFVEGAEPASPAANSPPEPVAAAEPLAEVAAGAGAIAETAPFEPLAADPIAACGTALVMPESGSLTEAVLSTEAVPVAEAPAEAAATEAHAEAAVEEGPSEVTVEEAPVEVAEMEAHTEAVVEAGPSEVAAEEAPAEVAAMESHAETVADEGAAEVTGEEAHSPAADPSFIVPVPPSSHTGLTGEQPTPNA
ncbi:MAG: hypothetical protein WA265_00060 [Rhodomicrobium sp.]